MCASSAFREYRNTEASQSSSNNGSSSFSDLSRGIRVDSSARCVVSERSGRGYESGCDSSRICTSTLANNSCLKLREKQQAM